MESAEILQVIAGTETSSRCWTGFTLFPFLKYFCAAQLLLDMSLYFLRLEASRPVRNAKTELLDLVVLLICCEVALRRAVALGHVDRMHRTPRVSWSHKCQDPGLKVTWSCFFPSEVGSSFPAS